MFKIYAPLHGLEASDLGRSFTAQGKTFTINGWNTRAKKMPIQATDEKGNRYKFDVETVKLRLKRAA